MGITTTYTIAYVASQISIRTVSMHMHMNNGKVQGDIVKKFHFLGYGLRKIDWELIHKIYQNKLQCLS